jgi:hypothetical protein
MPPLCRSLVLKDVVRAALTADTFGMTDSLPGALRGPPEPAPKRSHSEYNTPLSLSPASDFHSEGAESGNEATLPSGCPPPGSQQAAAENNPTTIFRSPAVDRLEGERKPPLSPSSFFTTPVAIRPQSDPSTDHPFSV